MIQHAIPTTKQCVVLVGGKASRLGDVAALTPKPLLLMGERPFLHYLLHELGRHGFARVLLLAGHNGDVVERSLKQIKEGLAFNIDIETIREDIPLGTAGALRHAAGHLDPEFLFLNGDSFFDINFLRLLNAHAAEGWLAKIALKSVDDASNFGRVVLTGGVIREFCEKSAERIPGLINAGVYWLKREIVDFIPKGFASFEYDVLPQLCARSRVAGLPFDGYFIDIGVPDRLAEASSALPQRIRRRAVFLDRDGVLNEDGGYTHRYDQISWVPGAIEGVRFLNDRGYFVFVVTNQAGIARGYYKPADVDALHAWMNNELSRHAAHIDSFAYCPHHPEGAVAAYRMACTCRKPQPGLITGLLGLWPVSRTGSFLVGDKDTDVEAARRADIGGYLFRGGNLLATLKEIVGD